METAGTRTGGFSSDHKTGQATKKTGGEEHRASLGQEDTITAGIELRCGIFRSAFEKQEKNGLYHTKGIFRYRLSRVFGRLSKKRK